jgi:hypothetical protein
VPEQSFGVLAILASLILSTALAQSPAWPDGAGEYRFGMSRAAVMRACAASGGEYDRERERCSTASDAIGIGAAASSRVDFAFCRQRLCYVSIDARYVEITRAREVYERFRRGIDGQFAAVAGRVQDRSLISQRCQRSDAELRQCLRSHQAVIGQRWEFMNDPTVSEPSVEIDVRVIEALDADALVLTLRYAKRDGLEARAALDERLAAQSNTPDAPVP